MQNPAPDHSIIVPWGKDQLSISLPQEWELIGWLEPETVSLLANDPAEIERALEQPIGLPRLSELGKAGIKVALVIDDHSRPTPVARILPSVLNELAKAGVEKSQITVIPATGVHHPMSTVEIQQRIGDPNLYGLNVAAHDCDNPLGLTSLGTTRRGTPVLVCKTVAEADLIISIGCIEPHLIASYGGGYKNLVPGVAGRVTIAHNHSLNCTPATFNSVGQPIELNPMRLDLEEAATMLKPPVFIVNAVLNAKQEMVRLVCGHPILAHREGVRTSAKIYGAYIPATADIVISSSHPMDIDLRQGVKALGNTIRALRPGGVMIVFVRAEAGVGVFGLANRKLPLGRKALKFLAPLLLLVVPRIKLRGMGEEDRFFLYFALQAMRRGELLLYAPTIPKATQANLPFVTFMDDFETGLALARKKFPGKASVLVFPLGGSTFPILPA